MPKYPVAGPVNTALSLAHDRTTTDFRTLNCAACTAGALTGRTSGVVIAHVFLALNNPIRVRVGYEPDTAFTFLGQEARQRKGKGPKFPAPPPQPGQDPTQRQANVDAAVEESGLHAQVKALKHYFTSFAAPTAGHWVYAENRDHTVEFVDYQQFLPGGNRPDSTRYPSCDGGAAPDAKMLVLSFSP